MGSNIFDCYRSLCSNHFSIITLITKTLKKKPKYLNYVIVTGSNDFTNLCLFHLRCIFKIQWRSTPYCNFMGDVLIFFLSNLSRGGSLSFIENTQCHSFYYERPCIILDVHRWNLKSVV